jgi:hypothetical protein
LWVRPPKPGFLGLGNLLDDIRNTLVELRYFFECLEPNQRCTVFWNYRKFFFTILYFGLDSQCMARKEIAALLVSLINVHLAVKKISFDLIELLFFYQESWLWEKDKDPRVKQFVEARLNRSCMDVEGFDILERAIRYTENKPKVAVWKLDDLFFSGQLPYTNGWMFVFWKIWVERFFSELIGQMGELTIFRDSPGKDMAFTTNKRQVGFSRSFS